MAIMNADIRLASLFEMDAVVLVEGIVHHVDTQTIGVLGDRGIGAAVSGSVDTSAATMISLLAIMQERNIVEGAE